MGLASEVSYFIGDFPTYQSIIQSYSEFAEIALFAGKAGFEEKANCLKILINLTHPLTQQSCCVAGKKQTCMQYCKVSREPNFTVFMCC